MRYQYRFTVIAFFVVAIAGLFVSLIIREEKPRSSNKPPAAYDSHLKAEPRDALSGHSAETVGKAVDHAFSCTANFDSNYQELGVIADLLSKSKNPEHLLMAALFGSDQMSEARIHTMTKTLRIDPDNPLILWNFLNSCSMLPHVPICRDQNIENRAIEVDSSNGQLWAKIAGFRIKRGNMPAALDALKNASVAPEFNEYWMEHVELFERGLAAAGDASYRNRTIQAVGMAAAMVWNIKSVLNGCETQAVESGEWLQYCVRFAERLERDGRTILSNVIGLKLQETMYSISGDEEKEAAAEQRLRLIRNSMRNGQSEDGQVLLSRDDRVLADYITEWATFGELRAVQFLRNEVERLRNVSGYDPCRI